MCIRDSSSSDNANSTTRKVLTNDTQLQHKIALLLDACETIRFPFKKKLILNSLHMTAADIPVKDLYGTVLGQSLYKLSMSGNRLSTVPRKLVTCLPSLKSMDISQCELHQIPDKWNLPQLKRLNMSHNRLCDFPEEVRLNWDIHMLHTCMHASYISERKLPSGIRHVVIFDCYCYCSYTAYSSYTRPCYIPFLPPLKTTLSLFVL